MKIWKTEFGPRLNSDLEKVYSDRHGWVFDFDSDPPARDRLMRVYVLKSPEHLTALMEKSLSLDVVVSQAVRAWHDVGFDLSEDYLREKISLLLK